MTKNGWLTMACAATMALVISCGGGGGGSKSFSPTTRKVQDIQRTSAFSMAKGGIAMAPFYWGGSGGGTTGSGTSGSSTTGSGGSGGGSGITGIGFFFRDFGGPSGFAAEMRARMRPSSRSGGTTGGTSGSTTGSGGGTGGDNFYFDDWLQLWADVQWTDNTFTIHFYQDSGKTMPAGHTISSFTGSFDSFPQTYEYDYEFTAGTWAGAHGHYLCNSTSWTDGSMEYDDTFADGSHDVGQSTWSDTASSWHSRWDGPQDQGWFEDEGSWTSDGAGTYHCRNSEGWESNWTYNADWSGTATFTGPDPLLPATLVWTSEGHFTVTYADGSKEEWDWSDFWDSSEGGTTGAGF